MVATKHVMIGYHALNRCFKNKYRECNVEGIIDTCSKAVYNYCGKKFKWIMICYS